MNRNKLFGELIVFSIIYLLIVITIVPITASSSSLIDTQRTVDDTPNSIYKSDFPATGFFYVEKKDDVWWLVNPKGEKFYSIGIAYVEPSIFYYGNITDWIDITQTRLRKWGFNTLNGGNPHLFSNMPYIYKMSLKQIITEDGWTHRRIPDVFDQGWRNQVRNIINETAKKLRNDPYLIGYQTDNEMKWGPDVDLATLLEVYLAANKTTAGKNKVVEFLRDRYENNVKEFNHVWKMSINSFNDLFNYTEFGFKGWTTRNTRAKEDIDIFSRFIAETYFNFTNSALKNADPNHLNLGVRFFVQGIPKPVLEECGKYVDVISINYYRRNVMTYDPLIYLISRLFNCVTLDNWMHNYNAITEKPLLSSEYSFPGRDIFWPIFPRNYMLHRDIMINSRYSFTQRGRAYLFEWYTKNCLKSPYVIGHTWFRYRDNLNVVNWGLVNLWDEPYETLISRMEKINNEAVEIHENASLLSIRNKPSNSYFLSQLIPEQLGIFINGQSCEPIKDFNFRNTDFEIRNYQAPSKQKIRNHNTNNIIYVGGSGPGNFTLIQNAINNASDGDLVFVYNGSYNELININKSITLMGENRNGTIIIGDYDVLHVDHEDVVITISADNVKILGFTITSEGGYYGDYILRSCSGISLGNYDNCTIESNILKNLGSYGIRIRLSNNNTILGNTIFNVLNKKGCNIFIDRSNNSYIESNTLFTPTICCIWLSRCANVNIRNNVIADSYYCGIILETSNCINISRNSINGNKHTGLLLRNSNNNTINSNNFKKEINRRQAFFINSINNNWESNYWGHYQLLPKCIFGKNGNNGFIPAFNFDNNPAQKPYNY